MIHVQSYLTMFLAGLALAAVAAQPIAAQPAEQAAAARKLYKAVGAPAEPKVPVRWNKYYDYKQVTEILQQLAKAHPETCKLQSLGKSYGDREMWVLTVTDFNEGVADEKPAFWIDGGIHANELQAVEVTLYTAWYLLEMQGQLPELAKLLDERTFYFMPMMSPDSRDAHFYEPNTTHSPRGGQRPVDDDRDGLVDEDGYDDLDGDGHITSMRIRDPNGRYKESEEFPGLMVRVEDDEQGEFTLLGAEGIDNDGDGLINEDGQGYYDPNRDWGWNWQPGYIQGGAYRYPFSIKENRLVANFIMAHPNIAGAQSYHNTGGMILRGPGAKTDRYESADLAVYDRIGKQGEEILPGYRYINIANDLYEVYGGEIDWLYAMQGVFTFTNELFTPYNFFRQEQSGFFANEELLHKARKYLLFGEGFVEWKEYDHPEYGKIEIGGFTKNWRRQAPSFLLEEECHRNMAFTLYHAQQLPRVEVRSIEVEPLGGDLLQVTAVVANTGATPTHAAVDVKNKITRPDLVTISGQNLEVYLARVDEDLLFRSPTEQTRQPQEVKLSNIPGYGHRYVRWILKGEGPFTVKIDSVKGGRAEKTTEQQ